MFNLNYLFRYNFSDLPSTAADLGTNSAAASMLSAVPACALGATAVCVGINLKRTLLIKFLNANQTEQTDQQNHNGIDAADDSEARGDGHNDDIDAHDMGTLLVGTKRCNGTATKKVSLHDEPIIIINVIY